MISEEHLSWMSDLCISDISLVNTYITCKNDYQMKNNGRFHHGFLYTIEGTEIYSFHEKEIYAVPNSVVYIPKNEKYTIDLSGETSVVIVLDFELSGTYDMRPFIIKLNKINNIKMCFSEAEKIWIQKKSGYQAMCKSLIYKVIAFLSNREDSFLNSKNYSKISEAVNYLNQNYSEQNFKIEKLFEISNISPKYFETLFKLRFNMTPKEYVVFLRMERAKSLLLSEKCSVGEIAFQLGYSDIYHFSKTFKSKTGYTPSEFRHNSK